MFDVKVISFRNMILTVLLKWRLIVLIALVFAVITPPVMTRLDQWRAAKAAEEAKGDEGKDSKEEDPSPEVIEANISTLADLYIQYDQINGQLLGNENLGFDPNMMKYVYVQYHLEVPEENAAYINSIKTSYNLFVKDNAFVSALIDSEKSDIDPVLFGKYVTLTIEDMDMTVKAPYRDGMDPEVLLSSINKLVDGRRAEISKINGHSLQFIGQGLSEERNDALIKEQGDLTNSKNNVNNQIISASKSLSKEQIEYARKVADGSVAKDSVKEYVESSLNVTKEQVQPARSLTTVLANAFEGALAGAILAMLALCIGYAAAGKLRSEAELSKQADIMPFGIVSLQRKKRFLGQVDERIRRSLTDNRRGQNHDQQIADVVTSIALFTKKNEIKSICLSSTLYGKLEDGTVHRIIEGLHSEGISAGYVDDITYDKNALRSCSETDGVILIEQLNRSYLKDIENDLITSQRYGISLIGSVVFE